MVLQVSWDTLKYFTWTEMFVNVKHASLFLIFSCKDSAYLQWSLLSCSGCALKYSARIEDLTKHKHSSLFRQGLIYNCKMELTLWDYTTNIFTIVSYTEML